MEGTGGIGGIGSNRDRGENNSTGVGAGGSQHSYPDIEGVGETKSTSGGYNSGAVVSMPPIDIHRQQIPSKNSGGGNGLGFLPQLR